MSTIQDNQAPWKSLAEQKLDPKYEKCRNITEEIYKRINITFQIKKLESAEQSDLSENSEQLDSNELSNETDLFACDKSDLPSSSDVERPAHPAHPPPPPLINNNNNEERKTTVYKRPRKRFRKRVKKRASRRRSESEGSSDEAPLSRTLLILATPSDLKPKSSEKFSRKCQNNLTLRELLKPDDIKVPTVIIEKITIDKDSDRNAKKTDRYCIKNANRDTVQSSDKDVKLSDSDIKSSLDRKSLASNKSVKETSVPNLKFETPLKGADSKMVDNFEMAALKREEFVEKKVLSLVEERRKLSKDVKSTDWKNCAVCNLSFRGERGLRRHMSMSHIESPEMKK